jgi:hypothetical protein
VSESALLVGRKKSETSAYVMATSFTALFSQLTAFEKASYPFSLAFVDQNTQALAGEVQETSLSITLPVEGADFFLHLSVSEIPTQSTDLISPEHSEQYRMPLSDELYKFPEVYHELKKS